MRSVVTFYKPFVFVATFFTMFTCFLLWNWGSTYFVLTLLLIKSFSSMLIGVAFHLSRAEQLNFYHNLGFSTARLYTSTAILDLFLWLVMIVTTAQFL